MEITHLRVDQIHAGSNPRSQFNDDTLAELAESIRQDGMLEPVRVLANADGYRLESGERRFRAAQLAGLTEVPAIVVGGNTTDEFVRAMVTNIQREDMNIIDEARGYKLLIDKHGLTPLGVAERLGVAQGRVTQRLELCDLPAEIIQLYYDGALRLDCRRVLKDLAVIDEGFATQVAKFVAGKDDWGAVLAKEPMRVITYFVKEMAKTGKYFLLPGRVDRAELKLRKKDLLARAEKQDANFAWTPVYEKEDLAVAANVGVAYTHKDSEAGVVLSADWMREHFTVVLERREKEIEDRKTQQAKWDAESKRSKMSTGDVAPENEANEAKLKEMRSAERQAYMDGRIAARAANLELGRALMNELAAVDVGKLGLVEAKLISYGLVGSHLADLFLSGLRYCLPEFQREVKTGPKGDKTKIEYTQTKTEAIRLARDWLAVPDKPGEIVGRALILVLCACYADQGAVPQSDRHWAGVSKWDIQEYAGDGKGSLKPLGVVKAVEALAKAHVPAELRGKAKPSEKLLIAVRKKFAVAPAQEPPTS